MSKFALLSLILINGMIFRVASAENLAMPEVKIENPANQAIQELTESNIEQALAAKESKAEAMLKVDTTPKSEVESGSEKRTGTNAKNQNAEISAQAPENEIPVQLEARKGGTSESNPFVKMILGLLVVSGLSVAAWLGVRRYRFQNRGANPATQMKVLSQFHLGPKKSLVIVRVAGESVLIGVTDHNITLIKSLSLLDEDVPENSPENFGQTYQKAIVSEDGDDFAISGIKDFVSTRLKNMRSFE